MTVHVNSEESDRDLLVRIDERTENMNKRLEAGAVIMEKHEERLQAIEKLVPTFTTQMACVGIHKAITANYNKLLIALLIAALGIIGAILKWR